MISGISSPVSFSKKIWNILKPISLSERVVAASLAILLYCHPVSAACGGGLYSAWKLKQMQRPYARILSEAPLFKGYKIGEGTRYPETSLTSLSIRPANLFYQALLGRNPVTEPGSGELFAFRRRHSQIRRQIASADPNQTVAFSARGVLAKIHSRERGETFVPDLAGLLGPSTYRISYGELQTTLDSQKIYVSPLVPLPFYRALKKALLKDGIVTLPGDRGRPVKLSEIQSPACRSLVQQAAKNCKKFGFASRQHCVDLFDLTLYQLGALVVKSEDFRIFIDGNGKMVEREPGDPDAIRLINACGVRGIQSTPRTKIDNRTILTQTFQTALSASEKDLVVFPAVGMGVWRGDPDLYWRAFFDAVVASKEPIERIFVNPGHQPTVFGRYRGRRGDEFQTILNEYMSRYRGNSQALANLGKIDNLFDRKTDLVQLAHQLKRAYPDKTVSLFNASDPDVTLGNHVGEYVNNLDHCSTTEENYTALGTNGLCFETITGVHDDPRRVVSP